MGISNGNMAKTLAKAASLMALSDPTPLTQGDWLRSSPGLNTVPGLGARHRPRRAKLRGRGYTKPPVRKRERRARGKRQRQARKVNRGR